MTPRSSKANWGIAVAIGLQTVALAFWLGRLAESVDSLKRVVDKFEERFVSNAVYHQLEERVGRLDDQVAAIAHHQRKEP